MVTGDHIDTARWVGLKTGLITAQEAQEDGVIMTGAEFAEKIGQYDIFWNEEDDCQDVSFTNIE